MRRILFPLGVLVSVAVFSTAFAQPRFTAINGHSVSVSEIDHTLVELMRNAKIPGAAIALFNHGKLVYLKAYGVRDEQKHLPLTVDSVISAASFSKVAFAYLVMKLVDEHALDLDKPVYQYLPKPLPQYAAYADLGHDPRYRLITARMLLDHTGGFPNWRWLEPDRRLRIHFQPGTKYAYSGEGIDLLQLVIETITSQPLEQLMQEKVFRPLAMTRTSMVWNTAFDSDYANGYDEFGRSLGPQRRKVADAAGSMQTTISDFAKFVAAIMAGKGLSKKSFSAMLSPQIEIDSEQEFPTLLPTTAGRYKSIRLSYGLGWGLYWTPFGKAIFKEGHDEGWRNYTVAYLPQKTGMVIMTNSSNGEGIYKAIFNTLLGDTWNPVDWEGFTPYDKLPPRPPLSAHNAISLPPAVLDLYVGRYGHATLVLNVRREGDHLVVQENKQRQIELFPQSGSVFFSKTSDDVYTFQFDSQSHAAEIVLQSDGKYTIVRKLE